MNTMLSTAFIMSKLKVIWIFLEVYQLFTSIICSNELCEALFFFLNVYVIFFWFWRQWYPFGFPCVRRHMVEQIKVIQRILLVILRVQIRICSNERNDRIEAAYTRAYVIDRNFITISCKLGWLYVLSISTHARNHIPCGIRAVVDWICNRMCLI